MAAKLADYREVLANVEDATVDEVWYVDAARVAAHPRAAAMEGETAFPELLDVLLGVLGR